MGLTKTEAGLFAAGGVGLLASVALIASGRRRIGFPALAVSGGLLAGGAFKYSTRPNTLGGPLGLVETERVHSGGMRLRSWDDAEMGLKERVHLLQGLVAQSVKDPEIRKKGLEITNKCPARDDRCELQAIFDWTQSHIRYTGDIGAHALSPGGPVEPVDTFQSAKRTIEFKGGDCLPAGTLLLVEGHRLVPIEDVLPGSKIWGYDRWSVVGDVWAKGELPIDAIRLNNGSWIKATPDHKVYVAICPRHGRACSCPVEQRVVERIRVSQLKEQMVLLTPGRIPFGTNELDPDRAYIEGLYLADGWQSHEGDFDIAGRDGHPKEAQKTRVREICDLLGVETTWFEKSIRVRDPEWAHARIASMGHRAPEKRALSIDLNEDAAAALLEGIMADSGANTNGNGRTFTSTSRDLVLQTRLLWKMRGATCSERYIEAHGGLGQNPIWRLGVRDQNRSDGKREKLLRVRSIERGVDVVPVYDISTDDHYVYLPEADVTVSNCDDHTTLNAALAIVNGFEVKMRITSNHGNSWDHIYALAGIPKMAPKKWIALDTTLRSPKLGRQPRRAKYVDYAA